MVMRGILGNKRLPIANIHGYCQVETSTALKAGSSANLTSMMQHLYINYLSDK